MHKMSKRSQLQICLPEETLGASRAAEALWVSLPLLFLAAVPKKRQKKKKGATIDKKILRKRGRKIYGRCLTGERLILSVWKKTLFLYE